MKKVDLNKFLSEKLNGTFDLVSLDKKNANARLSSYSYSVGLNEFEKLKELFGVKAEDMSIRGQGSTQEGECYVDQTDWITVDVCNINVKKFENEIEKFMKGKEVEKKKKLKM